MKKIFFSLIILLFFSACSQAEDTDIEPTDDILSTEDVKIPDVIFTSEKQNSIINEEEIKASIKTYLDSYEELYIASSPFQELIDEEKELSKEEVEKLNKINKLTKENDENFSAYILNNTLPEGYQEETERISHYITGVNEFLYEIDELLNKMTDDANNGDLPEIDLGSLYKKSVGVNGREQKKIEDFLDKKKIDTKAFGRDQ
ncbi:NDxxF motif lipoprotein [Metabacillus malikii]|uniref:NDxxF motif lipoprotein n=1 Tax=Metabacillus malikii TaxID=1504265 RepID=A0ABT9ZD26_9BACI|nr:NDxxF motif lipoprotein [Metabacillus malikii]MDQ0230170.1 hypothetical protein [Metabacillus malikii]